MIRRLRIGGEDFALFDKVDNNAQLIDGAVVFDVAVQTISLFYQDGRALASILPKKREHLTELRPAWGTRGFNVNKLRMDLHTFSTCELAQQFKLSVNREPFALLFLA